MLKSSLHDNLKRDADLRYFGTRCLVNITEDTGPCLVATCDKSLYFLKPIRQSNLVLFQGSQELEVTCCINTK